MSNSGREHRFGEVKGEEDMLLKEMLLVFRLSKTPSSTLWCAWFESERSGQYLEYSVFERTIPL
jgi:hypothetical protein